MSKQNKSPEIPPIPLKKRLYTIKEAAEYLGRSYYSMAELIRSGAIPFNPVGREKRIDLLELDRYIQNSKMIDSPDGLQPLISQVQ